MHIINVTVRDKIADNPAQDRYVCGNSDYIIRFDFDAEWDAHATKTARFIAEDGKYKDQVFTGNDCPVPVIENTYKIMVGVYAGDLSTTTAAYVPAKKSILCGGGVPADPHPDVYAQIMELLNKGGVTPEQIQQAVDSYLNEHPLHVEETDPTVPDWAKQPTKPTYTAKEVGAQPKGDYALKNEIPAPYTLPVASADTLGGVKVGKGLEIDTAGVLGVQDEGVYELIDNIVCDGTYGKISKTGLALTHAKVYLHMKAANAATSLCVEAKNDAGMFGYAWLGNGINTAERWSYAHVVSDGEKAYIEYNGPVNATYGSAALNKTVNRLDASTPINRINVYATGGGMIPAESVIEIWGVRANA